MNNVREGSSKDVIIRPGPNGRLVDLRFTKRFSVFDVGAVPYEIEEMDEFRHRIATRNFEILKGASIPTHFIASDPKHLIITVEPFNIYQMNANFDEARGRIIPLEIIDRQEVTQPLLDRAKTNSKLLAKMTARVAGPLVVGAKFTTPLIECTTKFEAIDRRLSDIEAIAIAKLGSESYQNLCDFVAHASTVLTDFFRSCGYNRLDGKWEIAITYDGPTFVVVDSYSPDEMRLIGQDGRSYDKDPLRLWYRVTFPHWIKALDEAKREWPNDKAMWPKYPKKRPPRAVLEDLRSRYGQVMIDISA